MKKYFFRCKNCLMTSLRPRVSFNKDGICNACQNAKLYRNIDWLNQFKKLKELLTKLKKIQKSKI